MYTVTCTPHNGFKPEGPERPEEPERPDDPEEPEEPEEPDNRKPRRNRRNRKDQRTRGTRQPEPPESPERPETSLLQPHLAETGEDLGLCGTERAMGLNIHRRDGRGEESSVTWAVALGTTVKIAEDI